MAAMSYTAERIFKLTAEVLEEEVDKALVGEKGL
jgi:hypothetical protein